MAQALSALQADTPPLPFDERRAGDRADLGSGWRVAGRVVRHHRSGRRLIGQVHRAVWHDGRDVAVKIQYPGVAEALRVDIAAVSHHDPAVGRRGAGHGPPAPGRRDARARVEELDYRREGRVQQVFADAFAGDEDVVVPAVVYASSRVLVTEWLGGTPFTALADAPQAIRDRAGSALHAVPARADPNGPAGCTPTRTPATSASPPTVGWGSWTSDRRWPCPTGCRRPSAG